MDIVRTANLGVAFLLEMCMLYAYGYWASKLHFSWALKIVVGIAVISFVITLWALFAAPNAGMRLNQPWLFIFQLVIFGIASALLYIMGQKIVAVLFMIVWLVSTILSVIWKQ